jgi:hypothetical protein
MEGTNSSPSKGTSALIFLFFSRCVIERLVEDWVLSWGFQYALGLGIDSWIIIECGYSSEV